MGSVWKRLGSRPCASMYLVGGERFEMVLAFIVEWVEVSRMPRV